MTRLLSNLVMVKLQQGYVMNKSFEENYKRIEEILEELEKNEDNLDKNIKLYEEANGLYKKLEQTLDEYKAKIELIGQDE